jgi:hypothetical protein
VFPFDPRVLIRDLLTGRHEPPPRVPPHLLPLCTYCDHSHVDHPVPASYTPSPVDVPPPRPCRYAGCRCEWFRDPDVMEKVEI